MMRNTRMSLCWDSYPKNICNGLSNLQQRGELVDMTIAADGHHVKVHQVVLSLMSPYIKELIMSAACPHPVIFLTQVSYQTLESILEYAYTGEVMVSQENMKTFLDACTALHIKGLENTIKTASSTLSNIYTNLVNEMAQNTEPHEKHNAIDEIFTENINIGDDETDAEHVDDNDTDIEMTTTMQPIKTQKTEKTAPVGKALSSLSGKFSVSRHGKVQLVLNRYIYTVRHTRKHGAQYWRCVNQQTTGCRAHIATLGDLLMERKYAHNHSFHDAQILKRTRDGNLFLTIAEAEDVQRKMQETKHQKKLKE